MHRTYVHDDGKVHEYFFGPMEATKSERWVTLTLPGNEGCVVALHLARTKEDQAYWANKAVATHTLRSRPRIASVTTNE